MSNQEAKNTVGQNKYESKVTKSIEYAPIVASIVGSNGKFMPGLIHNPSSTDMAIFLIPSLTLR